MASPSHSASAAPSSCYPALIRCVHATTCWAVTRSNPAEMQYNSSSLTPGGGGGWYVRMTCAQKLGGSSSNPMVTNPSYSSIIVADPRLHFGHSVARDVGRLEHDHPVVGHLELAAVLERGGPEEPVTLDRPVRDASLRRRGELLYRFPDPVTADAADVIATVFVRFDHLRAEVFAGRVVVEAGEHDVPPTPLRAVAAGGVLVRDVRPLDDPSSSRTIERRVWHAARVVDVRREDVALTRCGRVDSAN